MVETADAADPPSDFAFTKAGTPGASDVLLRTIIARRSRLKTDLAGSQGQAEIAASAQTDLDVRHDGASIGIIRFAASTSDAVFVAASETILEPGDLLELIAPASSDATLADLAITLAGALVSAP